VSSSIWRVTREKLRTNWGALLGGVLAAGLGLLLLEPRLHLGEKLIHLSYDVPFYFRPMPASPQEVVLVYLDDDSHGALNQPYNDAWDRGLYAQLLDRLTADRARAVGFDIIFSDLNTAHPAGDEQFARAIRENGKVVLGADYLRLPAGDSALNRAHELFSDAAAAFGIVQTWQDQDFMVRRHLHVPIEADNDAFSSLSWQIARLAGAQAAQDPKFRYLPRWLNYYGPPGYLPHVSFAAALDTNRYPAGSFSNKIVIVGANVKVKYSGERKDELRTPFTRGNQFAPAVDVQATQVLNLVRDDWLRKPSPWLETWTLVIVGLLVGFGLAKLRPVAALGGAVAAAVLVAVVAQAIFTSQRIWFAWLIIVAVQVPVALLWSVVFNSIRLYVETRLYRQSLEMYLSPKLVEKFAGDRSLLQPGARKQVLTAFFSDIVGFSSIAEGLDSDELARLMNDYFGAAVASCIHATDGTVVKYMGDGIFAFWNAPEEQADHAAHACRAALLFRKLPIRHINGQPLVTRIGLHTGVANVGNFGSNLRVDYTALGDTINLASRLEGLNRHLGTEILISADTYQNVREKFLTRFLGKFRVKGFEKSVGVYELAGSLEMTDELRPLHETFARGLKLYAQRDFVWAQAEFNRALEVAPEDGPSKFYLKSITELDGLALPGEWGGETTFTEK
jgi:adenylate cyclase